jgi:hypothetical protein
MSKIDLQLKQSYSMATIPSVPSMAMLASLQAGMPGMPGPLALGMPPMSMALGGRYPPELLASLGMYSMAAPGMSKGIYPPAGMPGSMMGLPMGPEGALSTAHLQLGAASFPPMHMGMYPGMPAQHKNSDTSSSSDESGTDSKKSSSPRKGSGDEGAFNLDPSKLMFAQGMRRASFTAFMPPSMPPMAIARQRYPFSSAELMGSAVPGALHLNKKRSYEDFDKESSKAGAQAETELAAHSTHSNHSKSDKGLSKAKLAAHNKASKSSRSTGKGSKDKSGKVTKTDLDASDLLLNFAMTKSLSSTTSKSSSAVGDAGVSGGAVLSSSAVRKPSAGSNSSSGHTSADTAGDESVSSFSDAMDGDGDGSASGRSSSPSPSRSDNSSDGGYSSLEDNDAPAKTRRKTDKKEAVEESSGAAAGEKKNEGAEKAETSSANVAKSLGYHECSKDSLDSAHEEVSTTNAIALAS